MLSVKLQRESLYSISFFLLLSAFFVLISSLDASAATEIHTSLKSVADEGKKLWGTAIMGFEFLAVAGAAYAGIMSKPAAFIAAGATIAGAEGGKYYLNESYAFTLDMLPVLGLV